MLILKFSTVFSPNFLFEYQQGGMYLGLYLKIFTLMYVSRASLLLAPFSDHQERSRVSE